MLYKAMLAAAPEITWLVSPIDELGMQCLNPVTLYHDNQLFI